MCTKIPFEINSYSPSMDCFIQLYSKSYDVKSFNVTNTSTDNNVLLFLKQTVRNSFMHKDGNYSEPAKDLLQ